MPDPSKPGGWARTSRHARGYGTAWDRLRAQILARDCHICQCSRCKADGVIRPASEVDHILPKAKGGTDDPSNLQSVNPKCHRIKGDLDAGRRTRPAFDRYGNPVSE